MSAAELLALAERVERAEGPNWELDALAMGACFPEWAKPEPPYLAPHCEGDEPIYWHAPVASGFHKRPVPHLTASLDAALSLVPEGWRVSALEQDWETGLWRAQLGPKPSPALVKAYHAGRTIGWESADSSEHGEAAVATPALALCAAALRARAQAPQSPPRADAVAGVKEGRGK